MRGQPAISRIYDCANAPAPVGGEAERRNLDARKIAWQRFGLLVIDPADVDDDWLRQAIMNEGNRRFGKRGRQA